MCLRKMLMVIVLSTLGMLFSMNNSWALPDCPASQPFYNCYGSYTWENGGKYVGEWGPDGKMNGQGTSIWTDGQKYVGEWKDNKNNGQGKDSI